MPRGDIYIYIRKVSSDSILNVTLTSMIIPRDEEAKCEFADLDCLCVGWLDGLTSVSMLLAIYRRRTQQKMTENKSRIEESKSCRTFLFHSMILDKKGRSRGIHENSNITSLSHS